LDILLEDSAVALQHFGGLFVEGVFGIRFEEEVLESVDDGIDGQHGFPVLAEDVEADVALEINVRVIDLGLTFHFRRLVRIRLADFEAEHEFPAAVEALVWADGQLEG